MSSNLYFRIGGSAANEVELGVIERSFWTPEVDEHFERYVVHCAAWQSWANFETYESSLVAQLKFGPLTLQTFPRGRARIISLTNSGGTLVNSYTGTVVNSVFVESVESENRFYLASPFNITFVKARKTALNTPNLFYRVGGSSTNTIALGAFEDSEWTPTVDGRFEHYECHCITDTQTWALYEQYERSLANSLALGPIQMVEYPRGGGRIVSFANSGGSLYNATTGTVITSVFPEAIATEDHSEWSGKLAVSFVKGR